MALKRPKAKTISAEAMQNILTASAEQTGSTKQPKSYDPNFPAWEVPVNTKVLVYVPNHTMTMPDGTTTLRMDKFAAHDCRGRNTYARVRCTAGIVDEELGLDGSCPFCEATAESWELYNKEYADAAAVRGIDLNDAGAADMLKAEREELKKHRAVDQGRVYYTFPIVVIECESKNGEATTQPKFDESGKLITKVYWYSISENAFEDKWIKSLEAVTLDDGSTPTNPAGLWFVLNYKVAKNTKADKMNSAKALQVVAKNMGDSYKTWAEYFDKITEEWTPAKAMETLVANALRDGAEQKEACDEIMKVTRDKLAMRELQAGSVPAHGQLPVNGDANAVLGAFGAAPATPATPANEALGALPAGGVVPPQVGVN